MILSPSLQVSILFYLMDEGRSTSNEKSIEKINLYNHFTVFQHGPFEVPNIFAIDFQVHLSLPGIMYAPAPEFTNLRLK